MFDDKKGNLTIRYWNEEYGQDVVIQQEYSADSTWMEFIPQINAFFHACQFIPRGNTFVEEVEADAS